LTDEASELFRLLYTREHASEAAVKERLRRRSWTWNLFANSIVYEEPDDWRSP